MATTPSSSPLTNLMARRQQVQRTRDIIGLSSGGASNGPMRSGKPINPAEPGTPTADQPAQTAAPAPADTAFHPDNVPDMQNRDDMLAYTQQMLTQAAAQGKAVAPTPAINQPPPAAPASVTDQIQATGSESMSPEMQFMRIAGRVPSGRDMSMYYATVELARQLGRNPTKNELMMYMTQPQAEASPVMIPGVNV